MENNKVAHFPQKRKLILKKLSKFGSSAGVRLCHCSNPGRSTVHRRRACPAFAKRPRGTGWAGRGPTSSSRSWAAARWRSCSSTKGKSAWEHDCTLAITCTMYLAHTHQAQADRMRKFFLCAVGSTMSWQLNLFGKPVVRKAGPYRSPYNRYEKFVNAYVACNPGLPLVEAKRKADDSWREKTRKKLRWCCRLKLLLRRRTRDSLGAVSSWINGVLRKDDIDYCQKMCDKPFG